jgi:hypothetical protein
MIERREFFGLLGAAAVVPMAASFPLSGNYSLPILYGDRKRIDTPAIIAAFERRPYAVSRKLRADDGNLVQFFMLTSDIWTLKWVYQHDEEMYQLIRKQCQRIVLWVDV